MSCSRLGRIGDARGGPTVGAGIVSSSDVKEGTSIPATPDDHFAVNPDCRVGVSAIGRACGASRHPTIRTRIVSPARVQLDEIFVYPAPHDHFSPSPDCGVRRSCIWSTTSVCGGPAIGTGVIWSILRYDPPCRLAAQRCRSRCHQYIPPLIFSEVHSWHPVLLSH